MSWLTWVQCAWAIVVLAMVAERAYALFLRYPVSEAGLLFVTRRLREGDLGAVSAFLAARPRTLLAQLLAQPTADDEDAPDDPTRLTELSHKPLERLLALRVAATLSSTLGLLGGVVSIARGMGGGSGLVALEEGLAQRVAMHEALSSMALGVGTAAVCFYAVSRLRRRATELVTQLRSVAHLRLEAEARDAGITPTSNSPMRQALPRE
jgi:biopolymer transport protein ExbB/TolQ